jgi:hypothetical protein
MPDYAPYRTVVSVAGAIAKSPIKPSAELHVEQSLALTCH